MFPLAPLVSPHPSPHHDSVRFLIVGSSFLVFVSKVLFVYAYTRYSFNFQDGDCVELLVSKSSKPTMV